MNILSIAKVLKPQGIKGEMKCLPLTQRTEILNSLKTIICENIEYNVVSSKFRLGFVYICLENVKSIEDAEKFRNKEFFITKEDFGALDENTFFIEDLVGLEVVDTEGNFVGHILGVENYGASDILEVKDKWATHLVPFIKQVFVEVDIAAGKIVMDMAAYQEHRA
ncbi:MAG: 16S rRNA processing protein RimM [Clostridia bacterium]|nr:16S rRNA processing protein RimM [Clostridia bacterium]